MEEEIDQEEIKKIFKKLNKYSIPIIVICLFFLFYQLGFIYGYNQAFHLQEDYYEEKIEKFCICQDESIYKIPKPLDISFNFSKKEK